MTADVPRPLSRRTNQAPLRVLQIINGRSPMYLYEQAFQRAGDQLDTLRPQSEQLPPSLAAYDALLVSGGGANTCEPHPWMDGVRRLLRDALRHDVPTLGVCLGAQLLCEQAGGHVIRAEEIGWYQITRHLAARTDELIAGLPDTLTTFQFHSYACSIPPGAVELASSEACTQAFRIGRCAWGLQAHLELSEQSFQRWASHDADELRL
jgi:GMP synthase-like glutamine amidotransferase